MPQRKPAMTAKAFEKLVERTGLTQLAVAEKLGVNRRTVARWLSGETPISKRNAHYIKSVLKP
jgi:transcriptional regulator with XRE-family HTH domain